MIDVKLDGLVDRTSQTRIKLAGIDIVGIVFRIVDVFLRSPILLGQMTWGLG